MGEAYEIRLIDPATGTVKKSIKQSETLRAVVFSPDGKTLATGGQYLPTNLEGLSGKGKGLRITDGAVYFKQLDAYVTDRVKELSAGRQRPVTSVPRVFRDFPISKP